MPLYVYPYNSGSKSARALVKALGGRLIRRENSLFRGSPEKTVINWGNAEITGNIQPCRVINKPQAVGIAHNKLSTFRRLNDNGFTDSVPWTSSQEVAQGWLDKGFTVVARKRLTSHSGHGIEILEKGQWEEAPLYTQYVPKDREYRLHVILGQVIDVQRKIKDPSIQDVKDWKIRNHQNGFIFVRNDDKGMPYSSQLEDGIRWSAIQAVRLLGLDFGAVDVIYNRKRNSSYVLEVNTAPGLEGHTVEVYAAALRKLGN